jgi:hypothetical protein
MNQDKLFAKAVQSTVEKAGTEISYVVGNATEKTLNYGQVIGKVTRGGLFIETGRSVGTTAFKAAVDIAKQDKVCAGACIVAAACEVVAGVSALTNYPGALRVYFVAKGISVGCMRFRELCKNAKGENIPC